MEIFSVWDGGGCDIFKFLEFCSGGKFSGLRAGIYCLKAGLMRLAISAWLVVFITSAEDLSCLTELEAIVFWTSRFFNIAGGLGASSPVRDMIFGCNIRI